MLRASLGVGVGWIGLSMLADGIPTLVIPHRMLETGGADATAIGLTTLVALGLAAALQPASGWLSDRVGRAPVIAAGTLVAVCGLALLVMPQTAMVGGIVALAGGGIAQSGYQPLLSDRIGASWRGRASGFKNAFDVGGAFAAFIVLGALLGSVAAWAALVAMAGALMAGFVASALLLRGTRPPREPSAQGAATVGRTPRGFAALVGARFLFLVGVYTLGRFLLLFLAERLGVTPDEAVAQAGMALAVLAVITVAASLPCGWLVDRVGRRALALAGGALAGAGIALVVGADGVGGVLVAGALVSLGSAAFGAASWAMLGDLAGTRDAGRLFGIANLGTAGAAAAAGLFGLAIDAAGYGIAFGLAASCSLVGGLIAWQLGAAGVLPAPVARRSEAVG